MCSVLYKPNGVGEDVGNVLSISQVVQWIPPASEVLHVW